MMMNKKNDTQKFDLDSIDCIEYINDSQAETLSAGVFSVEARGGAPIDFVSGDPGDASVTFPINRQSISFRLRNLEEGNEGNLFQVTFLRDGETTDPILFKNSTDSVRRREIIRAVDESGADAVRIKQFNASSARRARRAFRGE